MPLSAIRRRALLAAAVVCPGVAAAQTHRAADPVIQRIWQLGMDQSQTEPLAQVLLDAIGPRLAGSPELAAAQEWLLTTYERWGIPARREQYGTWDGWRQGYVHVDLVSPRVQTLGAELLAWSPGTGGPTEGPVRSLAALAAAPADERPGLAAGTWVLASPAEPTCRAPQELVANARPETVERLAATRLERRREVRRLLGPLGGPNGLHTLLQRAGALGMLTSEWSEGWGVNKVFSSPTEAYPVLDVSCEDYGMLSRMAAAGQVPRVRVDADAELLGEVPQFNVIAELRGVELPDEYVVLSAHLDSWHAGTGATDNGTGTIMMLEAMRILKDAYPRPRRTIIAGHWGAEEMGLIGSRAFTEDHPEVVRGLQAAFNQDNGTWRIERIEGQGLLHAGQHLTRWLSLVPAEIGDHILLELPGTQENGASDHSAFLCHGAPAFRLQSPYDEYRQYTWHTNRDTYDKVVFDDLKENATLAAMLAYAASEDPHRMPRDRAVLPPLPGSATPRAWVPCAPARRSR